MLKQELESANDQAETLRKENHSLRHDLMTLRLEVRQALLGASGMHPDDDIDDLDVDPCMYEMPYDMVKNQIRTDVRKDLQKHKKEGRKRAEEGQYRTARDPGETNDSQPGPIPDHLHARDGPAEPFGTSFPDDPGLAPDAGLDGLGLSELDNVPDLDLGLNFPQDSIVSNDPGYNLDGLGAGLEDLNYGDAEMKFD